MWDLIKNSFFPKYIFTNYETIIIFTLIGVVVIWIICIPWITYHMLMVLASFAGYFIIIHGVCRLTADVLDLKIYLICVYESCKFTKCCFLCFSFYTSKRFG